MKEKVEKVIEGLKQYLQADGGDVELVSVDESTGVVSVKLKGACSGCPMATVTLKNGIEAKLKEEVPEVKEVVDVQ